MYHHYHLVRILYLHLAAQFVLLVVLPVNLNLIKWWTLFDVSVPLNPNSPKSTYKWWARLLDYVNYGNSDLDGNLTYLIYHPRAAPGRGRGERGGEGGKEGGGRRGRREQEGGGGRSGDVLVLVVVVTVVGAGGGFGGCAAPAVTDRVHLGHHAACTALYHTHNGSVSSPLSHSGWSRWWMREGVGFNPASCG